MWDIFFLLAIRTRDPHDANRFLSCAAALSSEASNTCWLAESRGLSKRIAAANLGAAPTKPQQYNDTSRDSTSFLKISIGYHEPSN